MFSRVTRKYINSVLTILLMFLLPEIIHPVGPLTDYGIQVIAIVAGVVYGWCTVDFIWPSILGLIIYGFCGTNTVTGVFSAMAGNTILLQVISLYIFSGLIVECGISEGIAKRLINMKITQNHPAILNFLLLAGALLPAPFISINSMVIVWKLIYEIADTTGLKRSGRWAVIMVYMSAAASTLGICLFPFMGPNVALWGIVSSVDADLILPQVEFIAYAVTFMPACLLAFTFFTGLYARKDMDALRRYKPTGGIIPFNAVQKSILAGLGGMFILMILPSIFPASFIGSFLGNVGNTGIVWIIICVFLFVQKEQGPLFHFQKIARESVPWPVIISIGTIFTLSNAFNLPETGITDFLLQIFAPVLEGHSPYIFAFTAIAFTIVATNFINGAVVASIIIPIVCSFKHIIGEEMVLALLIIIITTDQLGIFMPSGGATGTMLYTNTDKISPKEIMFFSSFTMAAILVLSMAVALPVLILAI